MTKVAEHNSDSNILVHRLLAGRRVRIARGDLKGLEGTVTALRGPLRVLVQLQHGVFVEIDAHFVKAVRRP